MGRLRPKVAKLNAVLSPAVSSAAAKREKFTALGYAKAKDKIYVVAKN